MGCCDDPTEPKKLDRRELIRLQEQYGELVRELFTEDPERVILKQLNDANSYLLELAALHAHYVSVRLRAIDLLDKPSLAVLQQIVTKEPDSPTGVAAKLRLTQLGG